VLEVKEMKEWLERNDPYACGMHPYTSYQTVVPPKRGIMVGEDLLSSTVNAAVHHIESDLS